MHYLSPGIRNCMRGFNLVESFLNYSTLDTILAQFLCLQLIRGRFMLMYLFLAPALWGDSQGTSILPGGHGRKWLCLGGSGGYKTILKLAIYDRTFPNLFHFNVSFSYWIQVKKEAFEKRFKEKQIYEGNREVQDWLQRMTFDTKGHD